MAEFQRFQKPEKRKIVMYCDIFVYAHDLFIYSRPPLYGFGTFGGRSVISYWTSFPNIS